MGEANRRRSQQPDLIQMLPPGMGNGLPARYRPECVALFLFLNRLGATKAEGFFVNVDADSFPEFWKLWPELAMEGAVRAGKRLRTGAAQSGRPRPRLEEAALFGMVVGSTVPGPSITVPFSTSTVMPSRRGRTATFRRS